MKKIFLCLTLFAFATGSCSKVEIEDQYQLEDQPQKNGNDQKNGASSNVQRENDPNANETAAPDFRYTLQSCVRTDLGWWGGQCHKGLYYNCPETTGCIKMGEIGANPEDVDAIVYEIADVVGVSVEEFLDNKEDYLSAEYIAENEDLIELLNDFIYP